jgi:hypothetical protein
MSKHFDMAQKGFDNSLSVKLPVTTIWTVLLRNAKSKGKPVKMGPLLQGRSARVHWCSNGLTTTSAPWPRQTWMSGSTRVSCAAVVKQVKPKLSYVGLNVLGAPNNSLASLQDRDEAIPHFNQAVPLAHFNANMTGCLDPSQWIELCWCFGCGSDMTGVNWRVGWPLSLLVPVPRPGCRDKYNLI